MISMSFSGIRSMKDTAFPNSAVPMAALVAKESVRALCSFSGLTALVECSSSSGQEESREILNFLTHRL